MMPPITNLPLIFCFHLVSCNFSFFKNVSWVDYPFIVENHAEGLVLTIYLSLKPLFY